VTEDDGDAGLLVDAREVLVEHVAGDGVERREGLVHEQHAGGLGQRAGQGDALAHAAAQLVGTLAGERLEVHQREQLAHPRIALHTRDALQLERQGDVVLDAQPGQQRRLLETSAPACRSRTSMVPAVGRSRPATIDSSVDLPQPDAPTRQRNSPRRTERSTRSTASSAPWPLP